MDAPAMGLAVAPSRAESSWVSDPVLRVSVVAAAAVRAAWFAIHPPARALQPSDVRGYLARAATMLGDAEVPDAVFAMQSPGTHWLLALCQGLDRAAGFAPSWYTCATAVWWAASAGWALVVIATAARHLPLAWARAVAIMTAVWWPQIAASAFFLSEGPAALCVTLAVAAALDRTTAPQRRRVWLRFAVGAGGAIILRAELIVVLAAVVAASTSMSAARSWRARLSELAVWAAPLLVATSVVGVHARVHAPEFVGAGWAARVNRTLAVCDANVLSIDEEVASAHPGVPARFALAGGPSAGAVGPVRLAASPWDRHAHGVVRARCRASLSWSRRTMAVLRRVGALYGPARRWPDTRTAVGSRSEFTPWLPRVEAAFAIVAQLLLAPMSVLALVWCVRREVRATWLWPLAQATWASALVAGLFVGSVRLRIPYDGILLWTSAAAGAVWMWRIRPRASAGGDC